MLLRVRAKDRLDYRIKSVYAKYVRKVIKISRYVFSIKFRFYIDWAWRLTYGTYCTHCKVQAKMKYETKLTADEKVILNAFHHAWIAAFVKETSELF